jgi:hypothetical protein
MANGIPINLAVEDELGEQMLRVLLDQSCRDFPIGAVYGKRGNSYLRKLLPAFNNAAKGMAYLVFADLDDKPCPPFLIEDWFNCSIADFPRRRSPNLLFRIAVREVESWIMADRRAFAGFLGISINKIPSNTDDIPDPKRLLLELARSSRKKELREDLVPRPGDKRRIGPDYNGRLSEFLHSAWRSSTAELHSRSLAKTRKVLTEFHPIFRTPIPQSK